MEFNREFKSRCATLLSNVIPMITSELFDQLSPSSANVIRELIEASAHCLTIGAVPCQEWITVFNSLMDILEIKEDIRRLYHDEAYYKVLCGLFDYIRNEDHKVGSDYYNLKLECVRRAAYAHDGESIAQLGGDAAAEVVASDDNDNHEQVVEPAAKRGNNSSSTPSMICNENCINEAGVRQRARPPALRVSSFVIADDSDDDDFEPDVLDLYTQTFKKK